MEAPGESGVPGEGPREWQNWLVARIVDALELYWQAEAVQKQTVCYMNSGQRGSKQEMALFSKEPEKPKSCGSSKLNPCEFIGGFDGPAIAYDGWRSRAANHSF
jgi:hypothetical protein